MSILTIKGPPNHQKDASPPLSAKPPFSGQSQNHKTTRASLLLALVIGFQPGAQSPPT
jgi:hypothetical protein